MLKNYFKIAIAVLRRRKFFTFISLFGISFTLTILMVLTAFMDNIISPAYPDMKRDRSLYIKRLELRNEKEGWVNTSSSSFYFLTHYAGRIKRAEKMAIASDGTSANAYVNNKKIVIQLKYTNADFWEVADYDFPEGKPFNKQQIAQSERVAVICQSTKIDYFGDEPNVVGKYIEADNIKYRVIGVVKDVSITSDPYYANMFVPYTLSKSDYKSTGHRGDYSAVVLAKSTDDVEKIQKEYAQITSKIPTGDKGMDKLYSYADTYFRSIVRNMYGGGSNSGFSKFLLMIGGAIFLFMLLPTINLVNINITRIMERSSEIGVRKAFGASSKTLVYQFIIENIILTILGGLLGVIFSIGALHLINESGVVVGLHLTLNFTILFYGLLTCLLFGLISGVYPAWRMSKLNVVKALKAQ
ncbi:FtsX-like permease family protein [Mucilaginibacter sp. S1162]|uniref:FtsX-like permease family protein n=1 Tax=Mucilaginibacter humi TaxID=2732510 RepID=A0ABX1W0K0_9SPHI|nr:ABC transporter permease [Mucilaginibacter humi]NNU33640.1 FtsX-like permease family protein [Mucilaginibacter humi]